MPEAFKIPKDTKVLIAKTMEEYGVALFWYTRTTKHPKVVFELPSGAQGSYVFAPALKSVASLMNLKCGLRRAITKLKAEGAVHA